MNIIPGLVVTVRHYSLLNVFKCRVLDIRDRLITLRLTREFSITRFLVGDPIVAAYMEGDSIRIIGGRLTGLDPEAGQLEFEADAAESGASDRLYERYPLSQYADFRMLDTGKRGQALVKDISHYGVLILTRKELYKGQKMDIDIFLLRDILSLKAEIVRKHQGKVYMEYGLKILHNGPMMYNHIVGFIKKSQEEHVLRFNKE
jgi:hypothetical protein